MEKKEKWREKLEQFKQDDRYDYLIELLLPYTAGFRAGSLDRGFLPILCEVEELLDQAREEVEKKFMQKYKKREEEMNVPYSEEDGKEFWQGYQEGYHQGLKDMIIDTHYLDEEFQSKLAGII